MIKNSYFNTTERDDESKVVSRGSSLYVGQVKKIYYSDDPNNTSKGLHVEYDVLLQDGNFGKDIFRCRQMNVLGSSNDFEETILEDNKIAFEGEELDDATPLRFKNGTQVLVLFLNNKLTDPVIIGSLNHPKQDLDLGLKPATEADGVRKFSEFRGVQTIISSTGAYTLRALGIRDDEGKLDESKLATAIEMQDTGSLRMYDGEQQVIKLDKEGKTLSLRQYDGTISISGEELSDAEEGSFINEILMDKANEKITITTKSGAAVTVDGSSGEIKLQDNGEGVLKIKDSKVGLGTSSAEVITEFANFLQEMITHMSDLQTETHLGNLGYPTATPVNAAAYGATSAALEGIKALIDSINGGV